MQLGPLMITFQMEGAGSPDADASVEQPSEIIAECFRSTFSGSAPLADICLSIRPLSPHGRVRDDLMLTSVSASL